MCTQTHTNCAAKMLEQGWQVFLGHPDVAGVARLPVDGRVPQGAAAEKCGKLESVEILRMMWQMTEALIFFFLKPHLLFGTPQLNWPKKGPGPSWQIKKEFSSKIQRKDEKCLIWTYCSVEPSQLWLIWFDLIWFDLIWFDLIWFELASQWNPADYEGITQIQLPPHK